jgi:UDP-glucose 4-epimerase
VNPYGFTKLVVERLVQDYERAYGTRWVALRYFNAAGADPEGELGERHEPETHLIPIVLEAALGKRAHLTVYGRDYPTPDGTCIRDYIHIIDLAAAHMLALEAKESAFYNLGTGGGTSVREIIDTCRRVTAKEIAVVESARRPGDPARLIAASEKIRGELGWEPRFQDILRRLNLAS